MHQREAVLRALLACARPIVRQQWRADSCIASTAIAIDVLDYFGLAAKPLACRTAVWNRQLVERVEAEGRTPDPEELHQWCRECGAWSVGIGYGEAIPRPDGWPAHLVAIQGEEFLLDLSLDQGSRPHKHIQLGSLGQRLPADWRAQAEYRCEAFDCLLEYAWLPEDQSFRRSPDWRSTGRRQRAVGTIIRAVKDALKERGEA